MIIIPVYDSLMLPGVAVHFHKDVLAEYNVIVNHVDEEVLFLFSRHAAKRHAVRFADSALHAGRLPFFRH